MDNNCNNPDDRLFEELSQMFAGLVKESPINDMSDEEIAQAVKAQEGAKEKAMSLSVALSGLEDKLAGAGKMAEVEEALDDFYANDLFMFQKQYGLTEENSDVIKALYGMYNEFMEYMQYFQENGLKVSDERLQDPEVQRLMRFYTDLRTALNQVNFHLDWNKAEESIPEIIKVTAADVDEMFDLQMAVDETKNCDSLGAKMRSVAKVQLLASGLTGKPVSEKLDKFARGETNLAEMEEEARIWGEISQKVNSVLHRYAVDLN